MTIKKHIPNLITLGNLFCGILAIEQGFQHHFIWAGIFIVGGAVFDFFDGMAARLLKVSSAIGKELDSLADMVSFGVAPGVVMYSFLKDLLPKDNGLFYFLPYIAFLIPLSSAIRLAKFNIDENQSDKFIGLPTPANSLFFISLPLVHLYFSSYSSLNIAVIMVLLIVLFSWLLNANIELLALKFKTFKWTDNRFRFSFLLLALSVLIICFLLNYPFLSIPIIIPLYIIISIIKNHSQ